MHMRNTIFLVVLLLIPLQIIADQAGVRLKPYLPPRDGLIAAAKLKEPRPEALVDAIEDFFAFLRRGAAVQAYHAFASDDFKRTTSESDWRKLVKRHEVIGRNKDVIIFDQQFSELYTRYYATIKLVATGMGGDRNLVEIDAVHEHGRWKILGLQIYRVPNRLLESLPGN